MRAVASARVQCRGLSAGVRLKRGVLLQPCPPRVGCASCLAMPFRHMTPEEVRRMDRMQKAGRGPKDIARALQHSRTQRGEAGPSHSAVYSFLSGKTYARGRAETRGRKSRLPRGLIATANRERIRLIQEADNEYLVAWGDIAGATKRALKARGALGRGVRMPSADWLARRVRAQTDVRARPGKRRISRFPQHVTVRAVVSVARCGVSVRVFRARPCGAGGAGRSVFSALCLCVRPAGAACAGAESRGRAQGAGRPTGDWSPRRAGD